MALATHLCAFLFLFPIGIRRLLCCSSLYLKNPSLYKSKPWYVLDPKYKNFDLYLLCFALPIASFSEFFLFLSISGNPTYRFTFFQNSVAILLFWALLILIIYKEYFDPSVVNESFVYVFAGIMFFVEYSVIGKGFDGLSGSFYDLLGRLTLICGACCLYLSIRPCVFFTEFFLSCGIVFKGTWVLQAGLNLYSDSFALKGCQRILIQVKNDVRCDVEEDSLRGMALMNLIFIGHVIGVLVSSFALFGLLSGNQKLRCGEASGPLLAQLDSSENMPIPTIPEFEIE